MPDFLLRKDTGELEIVSGTEPFTVTPAVGSGSYEVYRLDNSGSITLGTGDLTAPSLSELNIELSNDQATLNWSTDEANGTAYWVCTTQVDTPSSTQVISGQDHTGAPAEANGTVAANTSGAQSSPPLNGLAAGQNYTFHLLQQDASGNISNILSNTATIPGSSDTLPPVLRYLDVSLSGSTAQLTLSSDEANGTLYWVLTTSAQEPAASHILAGQSVGGTAPVAAGNQPVSTVDTQPAISVASLNIGTQYHFYILHRDDASNLSTTETISFTPSDVIAPTLSAVSATAAGTTGTLNWATDEGNGTGYWVCTATSTAPSDAQVIAGQNENGFSAIASGMQSVTAAGAQAEQIITGLANGQTYFFHLLHRDDSGNTSSVSSTTGVTVSNASASINIVERSADRVAPEGFFFDITLNGFDTPGPSGSSPYDPRLHELYYYWDFGDPGTFTSPENMIDQHKNSNTSYGPTAVHTYRSAGNYTVSCLVVEPSSGKSTVASLNIAVGNPEALFAGANTIFVDTTGSGTGAPAGAAVRNSLAAAFALVGGQEATPKRIMLRRGQTFAFGGYNFRHIPTIHMVAQNGTGAKPVINQTGTSLWNNLDGSRSANKDLIVQGLDFRGGYDTGIMSGPAHNGFFFVENAPQQALFDQCDFDGFETAILVEDIGGTGDRINLICNDNHVTNWKAYGFYGGYGHLAFAGNRFTQNVNALSGSSESGIQGSALRMQSPRQAFIHGNEFFANFGWFVNVPDYFTAQPAVRCMSSPMAGVVMNIQANTFEGGFNCFSFEAGPPAPGLPINALIEKNMMVGNHMTRKFGNIQYGGVTLRNNVCILPNVKRLDGLFNPAQCFDILNNPAGSAENLAAPIKVYNNTLINLMDEQNTVGTATAIPLLDGAVGSFSGLEEANNILHQPNLPSPDAPDAPLHVTPLWDARYLGYVDPDTPRDAATRTPIDTPALYQPAATSDALGDALNEPVAFDDFFGNPRPQYPSRGALEMP